MRLGLVMVLVGACAAEERPVVTLQLVARDGEDPLEGAETMRLELESEPAVTPEPRPIDPEGFSIDLDLPEIDTLSRVRLQLEDAGGEVVSRGATPVAPLELLAGVPMRLLLSRVRVAGTVTIADLPELSSATTLGGQWIVGIDAEGVPQMLDLLSLVPLTGVALPDVLRPGAGAADLGERRTLVAGGGEGASVYDGTTNLWTVVDDGVADGAFGQPVVLPLADGGAISLGGGRAEVVAFAMDGTIAWTAVLAAPRTGCAAAIAAGALVVYGGGAEDAPAAEVVELERHGVRVLVEAADERRGAAAAGVGARVLVVGGARGAEPLADGLWLDPGCDDGCPEPLLLDEPRPAAHAIGLDEERALVVGGGQAPEIVAPDGTVTPVPGPAVEARGILRAGTGDVWWFGPDGLGVYAE